MQKVTFLGVQFRERFLGASRRVLGSLLQGSGTLFLGLRPGVCEVCEKVCFWSVSWREEHTSCIAKTCKPYSTSFKNRRCASIAVCSCVTGSSILGVQKRILELPINTRRDFLVFRRLVQTFHFESFRRLQEVKFGALLA